MSLAPGQVSRLSTSSAPPAIAPVRQSMLGGAPAGFGRRPPQAVMTRAVVARTPPPAGAADAARVRLVAPGATRASIQRPTMQQPTMQQRQPMQQRPGGAAEPPNPADARNWADRAHALEQRSLPASHAPGYVPPTGARPAQPAEQGGVREVERGAPNAAFRADRPAATNQPDRFEQSRPPVTTYQRPQVERAPVERAPIERAPMVERAPMERGPVERPQFENRGFERNMSAAPPPAPVPHFQATPPPPAPVPHFQATPPPPAPVPHFQATPPPPAPVPHFNAPAPPPPAPARMAPPPQQHAPPVRDSGRPGARDRR
jgi:hypothetical protein